MKDNYSSFDISAKSIVQTIDSHFYDFKKFSKLIKAGQQYSANIKLHYPMKCKLMSTSCDLLLNPPQIVITEVCYFLSEIFSFTNCINNLNLSNKYNNHSKGKKKEKFCDNISTMLTSCFRSACRQSSVSSSPTYRIFRHEPPGHNGTSMSVPSSILESQSSGYSVVSQPDLKKTEDAVVDVNTGFEIAPRSFCQVSHSIIVDPPQKYTIQEEKEKSSDHNLVVEVDCSSSKLNSPNTSSWEEVLSTDWSFTGIADIKILSLDNPESRSILKTRSPPKGLSPSRLTFELGRNLVFEYPSYESLIDENNENNCRGDYKVCLSQEAGYFTKVFSRTLNFDGYTLYLLSPSQSFSNTRSLFCEEFMKFCQFKEYAQKILCQIQNIEKRHKFISEDIF